MIKVTTNRGTIWFNEEKVRFVIFINGESFVISKEAFKKLLDIKD